MNHFINVIKNFNDASGRASRAEFWQFSGISALIMMALAAIDLFVIEKTILSTIFQFVIIIPSVGVGIRRMHDIGKSGWFILIPIYSWLLYLTPSDPKENKYGPYSNQPTNTTPITDNRSNNVATFLGFTDSGINWSRVGMIFLALFSSRFLMFTISPLFRLDEPSNIEHYKIMGQVCLSYSFSITLGFLLGFSFFKNQQVLIKILSSLIFTSIASAIILSQVNKISDVNIIGLNLIPIFIEGLVFFLAILNIYVNKRSTWIAGFFAMGIATQLGFISFLVSRTILIDTKFVLDIHMLWSTFDSIIGGAVFATIQLFVSANSISETNIQSTYEDTSTPQAKSTSQNYLDSDNKGDGHFSMESALAYWAKRNTKGIRDPFILYTFDYEADAKKALLELPCVFETTNSGKLICTEFLTYGYYKIEDKFEAILCGEELTLELWEKAKKSFEKSGQLKNELKPEGKTGSFANSNDENNSVEFVREDKVLNPFGSYTVYSIHKAKTSKEAKSFLSEKPINKDLYYLVVETPEGNWGRDINGIYQE